MALDLGASFKISAGVVGQAAVDKLNTSVGGLEKGLMRLPGAAKAAGMAIAGLGAGLSLAVFKEKFDDVVDSILKVKDASERTGSAIERIGSLAQTAKITGDDFGTIEAGITRMNKALAGSDDEAKGAARALDAIGLKIQDLRAMDPSDAFMKIAEAMGQFEDGGGKAAVAMDIFGKSGAQLLPFMKDFVELGPQVSKVTQEQADQAENYERNVRLLKASQQSLYKMIATEALPVADVFVQSLRDTIEDTNGVKSAAQDLAKDGSMQSAFVEAGRAAAAFLDIASDVVKIAAQIGESFGVVWNDIKTGAKLAALGIGAGFTEEGRAAMAQVIAERDAYMTQIGKDFDKRWSSATPYSDAFEKRLAEAKSRQASGGAAAEDKPAQRSLSGYQSRTPTGPKTGGSQADPFGDALRGLGAEAAKLKWQTEHIQQYSEKIDSAKAAVMRFEVEQGKFKDLSEKQKTLLVMQAESVDQYAEALRQAKVGLEFENQTKAIDANTESLGLNSRERELAAVSQDLENKGIKQGTELYEKLMASRRAALERKSAAEADPIIGMKQGFADIADKAKSFGQVVREGIGGAFETASDALANFVMTGKLNFKSLATSILADLSKMILKQMIFNAISAGFSAAFGGGGGGVNASAGTASIPTNFAANGMGFTGTQAFAAGGIVDSPTSFKFASGGTIKNGLMGEAGPEAIVPLKRGRDGKLGVTMSGAQSGGGVTIGSIVVQNNGQAEAEDTNGKNSAAMGRALAAAVQAEILKQKRPGGLLYAA